MPHTGTTRGGTISAATDISCACAAVVTTVAEPWTTKGSSQASFVAFVSRPTTASALQGGNSARRRWLCPLSRGTVTAVGAAIV